MFSPATAASLCPCGMWTNLDFFLLAARYRTLVSVYCSVGVAGGRNTDSVSCGQWEIQCHVVDLYNVMWKIQCHVVDLVSGIRDTLSSRDSAQTVLLVFCKALSEKVLGAYQRHRQEF